MDETAALEGIRNLLKLLPELLVEKDFSLCSK